jgi:HlyD family secretion protein
MPSADTDTEKTRKPGLGSRMELFDRHSAEVEEILSRPPGWTLRWGITTLFVMLLALVWGAWFIEYPDLINASVTITTRNPPIAVPASTEGRLERLFVRDNDKVQKDDLLALIESTAEYDDMLALEMKLAALKEQLALESPSLESDFFKDYKLGDLQGGYSALVQSYLAYAVFTNLDQHNRRIASLQDALELKKRLHVHAVENIGTLKHELAQGRERHSETTVFLENEIRPSLLRDNRPNALPEERFVAETARLDLLRAQLQADGLRKMVVNLELQLKSARLGLRQSELEQHEIRKEIQRLELERDETHTQLLTGLQRRLSELSAGVDRWKELFLLKAPISGQVSFVSHLSIAEKVAAGDELFSIVPEDNGGIVGKADMPTTGSAKVALGQKVNIKLASYPYKEYGMLEGEIFTMSTVPKGGNYAVEIVLVEGMNTTYGKELAFRQEMSGSAEIITEDANLIQRIFNQFKSLWK